MLSLFNPLDSVKPSHRLLRDCLNHILLFCDSSTTSVVHLVCRSWYHTVDRTVCVGDTFYFLPTIRANALPPPSRKFPSMWLEASLRDDTRWKFAQHVYLRQSIACDVMDPFLTSLIMTTSTTLQKLDVTACQTLSDAGIRGLETISTLEDLVLSNTGVSDVSLLSVSKSLRKLDVSACCKITNEGIRGFENIPYLEELNFRQTKISDVTHLSGCKALRKLNVMNCKKLTNEGIRGLEAIPTLEDLNISLTTISDVTHLASSRALKTLGASYCQKLNEEGIRGLESIPTLTHLYLHKTSMATTKYL
eukprot:PhF_6_TR18535/c0_g1_i1/m.27066